MKIALYISPAHTVPPNSQFILAPWYLIGDIANHISDDPDYDVTLFASQGSHVRSKLYDFGIPPTSLVKKDMEPTRYKKLVREDEEKLFTQMMKIVKEEEMDIVHIHQPIEPLYPFISEARKISPKTKFVFTLHDPVSEERAQVLGKFISLEQCYFISISHSQFKNSSFLPTETVYNGVNLTYFTFNREGGEQFLSAGRIVPEKGYADAISAVKKVEGAKLLITGQIFASSPKSVDYFNSVISPELNGKTIFADLRIDPHFIREQYQKSKAYLFPIQWDEPFGLVMIEAMSCGTPVVAYNRGSVSEIVKDGITGFIVEPHYSQKSKNWIIKKSGVEGFAEAIERILALNKTDYLEMRSNCRKHVAENFSTKKMVDGYKKAYEKITKNI